MRRRRLGASQFERLDVSVDGEPTRSEHLVIEVISSAIRHFHRAIGELDGEQNSAWVGVSRDDPALGEQCVDPIGQRLHPAVHEVGHRL